MAAVTELTSAAALDALRAAAPVVLVDFYAPWCAPCRAMAPYVAALAREFDRVAVAKVDIDAVPSVGTAEHIMALPTFKLYRRGIVVGTVQGADRAALRILLEQHAR